MKQARSSVHRGVVVSIDQRTLWGWLVYAQNARGREVVDALSAMLLVDRTHWKPIVRAGQLDGTIKDLDFHLSSWHGWTADGEWLPMPGEIVKVHLNSDERLVALWYESDR